MPGRHWQLVVFTIVTQLAVGLTAALAVGLGVLSGRYEPVDLDVLATPVLEVVVVLLILSVPVAAIHLGSAGGAFKVFANLRSSWLSREAAAGIVFGLFAVAAALAYRLNLGSPAVRYACVIAAAVAGVALVCAMARLYMLRTVPAWNTPATPVMFLTAAAVLGAAGSTAVLLVLSGSVGVADQHLAGTLSWIGWGCLVLVAVQLLVAPVLGGRRARGPLWYLNAGLGLGGVGLLLAAARCADGGVASWPPGGVVIGAAAVLLVASEVVGRFRFYASFDRYGV